MKFRGAFICLRFPFSGWQRIFDLRLPYFLQLLNGYTSKKVSFVGFPSSPLETVALNSTPHCDEIFLHLPLPFTFPREGFKLISLHRKPTGEKKGSQINLKCHRPLFSACKILSPSVRLIRKFFVMA